MTDSISALHLDKAILSFLAEKKAQKVKKDQKVGTSEADLLEIQSAAESAFLLENWLPGAVKRVALLEMSTHPGKLVHPSAKISPIIAKAERQPDGFLRSGNVGTDVDVVGNSASLDVSKFLSLTLKDGFSVLDHLERNTSYIKTQLSIQSLEFEEVRKGLLAIKSPQTTTRTSKEIKQIYFPIGNGDYHLLSLLIPSGLIFKLKQRINEMLFSEHAKLARDDRRKGTHNETGFDELYNLTVIGFGGANPQNISELNAQNLGKSYLLPSFPPVVDKRNIRMPKFDFFIESLYLKRYETSFYYLHTLLASDKKNVEIRKSRDRVIDNLIESIISRTWQIRTFEPGWSENTSLPRSQRVWLDNAYIDSRDHETDWVIDIVDEISQWICLSYDTVVKAADGIPVQFHEEEVNYIKHVVGSFKEELK